MELISEFIPALQPSVYFETPSHQGQVSATQSPTPSTLLEIAALILLVIGGIILPVMGWFIGVILLWSSRVWTTDGKLAGTLLFPGGLLLPAGLGLGAVSVRSCSGVIQNAGRPIAAAAQVTVQSCQGPSALYTIGASILMAVLVIVPIAVAVVLARRMRARTASA